MAWRNYISVDAVNKIPIMENERRKRDQTSKYTILNNGAYYVYHDWYKNHKVRVKVVFPCPWYGYELYGFKLFMKTFMHKFLPKIVGVLRSTLMWYDQPFRWARRNWISFKIRNNSQGTRHYPDFWEHLGPVLVVSSNTGWVSTVRGITLNVFQSPNNLFGRFQIYNKEQCVINYHVVIIISLHS